MFSRTAPKHFYRVALVVAMVLPSLVVTAVGPGTPSASATTAGPGPYPVLASFANYSSDVQAWETNAEAQVAALRGVPDDLRNQLWSRGEIEADMFTQLVNMAGESNPSTSDQNVLNWFAGQYQANQEALANEAVDLYNQWAGDPCAFKLPLATGYLLAPQVYQSSYQSTIASICEQQEYDPYASLYCSIGGGNCISTPRARVTLPTAHRRTEPGETSWLASPTT